jgi:hypothetical protein
MPAAFTGQDNLSRKTGLRVGLVIATTFSASKGVKALLVAVFEIECRMLIGSPSGFETIFSDVRGFH